MESNQLSFDKLFHSATSSKTLELPPFYAQLIADDIPKVAYLINQCNLMWPVRIGKVADVYFFGDGWAKLVEDNSIRCGDMLNFCYHFDGIFDFKIHFPKTKKGKYLQNKSKRQNNHKNKIEQAKDWETIACDNKMGQDNLSYDPEEHHKNGDGKRNGKPMTYGDGGYGEKQRRAMSHVESCRSKIFNKSVLRQENPCLGTTMKTRRMNELNSDGEEKGCFYEKGKRQNKLANIKEIHDEVERKNMNDIHLKEHRNLNNDVEHDDNNDDDDYDVISNSHDKSDPDEWHTENGHEKSIGEGEPITDGGCRERPRRTRKNVDSLGLNIFNESFPRPKNPYFVTTLKPKRKNELFIPTHVVEDPRVDLPKKLTLVGPKEEEFTAIFTPWKNGRIIYKGGWSKLCKTNLVVPDDFCICEFAKDNVRGTYINVNFVRGTRLQS